MIVVAEEVFEEGVAGLAEPEAAFGVDVWRGHVEITAKTCLGVNQVEHGHRINAVCQRPGDFADVATQPAENAADFTVLLAFEHGPFGTQVGHTGRFDEDGLAGATGAMDHARQLVAMIDSDRQHIMIAVDRGIGITKDLA